MKILAIDTATEACSVAVTDGQHVYSLWEECPQQHAQKLLPMVTDILAKANIDKAELTGIAFGQGPGSFTGVRIATAHCQGLALGLGIPAVGISTLHTLAQGACRQANMQNGNIAVAIDARMGEVYFAQYRVSDGKIALQGTESVIAPELAAGQLPNDFIAAGTGWAAYPELAARAQAEITLPDARHMLALAQTQFAQGNGQAVEEIAPQYVRDTVTWKKLPGK